MQFSQKCILLFLRAPEEGHVKTRLAAALGNQTTLALYRAFVEDILEMLSGTGYPVILYGHPADKIGDITSWLEPENPCRPQTGGTLGEKMATAFLQTFSEGFEQVVLLGSDIPDLPPRIIHEAVDALEKEGAALGPSHDGGYYLIAFRETSFLPQVFENIPWSTETVLSRTLKVFQQHDTPVRLLTPWQDIDTGEDLKALLERYATKSAAAPGTLAFLREAGFKGARIRGDEGSEDSGARVVPILRSP